MGGEGVPPAGAPGCRRSGLAAAEKALRVGMSAHSVVDGFGLAVKFILADRRNEARTAARLSPMLWISLWVVSVVSVKCMMRVGTRSFA